MAGNTQRAHITGNGNQELQYLKFHNLALAPVTGTTGQFYYDTATHLLGIYDGGWNYLPKTYLGLSDTTDTTYTAKAGYVPMVNVLETGLDLVDSELATFLILADTPSTYSGQANKFLRVNAAETAIEFLTLATPITAVTDGIFNLDMTSGILTVAPYVVQTAASFDSSTTTPVGTTRLNWNGYLHATKLTGTTINIAGGTPLKYYGTDAGNNLVPMDDISAATRTVLNTVDGNGIITGMVLSINADTTKFNISAGTYHLASNGVVSYPGITGVSVTNLLTATVTYVAINSSNVVVQSITPFSNSLRRDYIIIGVIVHSNRTIINAVNNQPDIAVRGLSQTFDLMDALGQFNKSGNIISPNGANLSINKSLGYIFKKGANFNTDPKDPHIKQMPALTAPSTIRYRLSDGTEYADTNVLSMFYESAPGVRTAMSASKFYIQTLVIFPSNLIRIQYGTVEYNSIGAAESGIKSQTGFVLEQNMVDNGLILAYILIKGSVTNLTTAIAADDARILMADRFGGSPSGVANSINTLQTTYNNSTSPEILTDTTRGAFSVKRGSAADADSVIEVLNGGGTKAITLAGTGTIEVIRGSYIYHSQTVGADTAGDWRTYSNATAFYTEYCTVGNATKGSGTWVMKHTIQI